MKRTFVVLITALVAGATVFGLAYLIAQQLCARQLVRSTDDLAWLLQEFHLSDAEMGRIRGLHEGYLPRCGEMCARIAEKKLELEQALADATNVTVSVEGKLTELAALRTQCQLQMLRHFTEVSQAMPSEQGRRYLAEMHRLTLGFHEMIEQSMSPSAGHAHGYN